MNGENKCVKAKLGKRALGLTFGVIKGVWLMVAAWVAMHWGTGMSIVEHASQYYYGYDATILGGFIGFVWGFVVGFIFGVIFGYLYNKFLCACYKK